MKSVSLGHLLNTSTVTGIRAFKMILEEEGYEFISGKFPLVWAKETPSGAELISFFPDLKCDPKIWIGRELIANTKSFKTLLVESLEEQEVEKDLIVPSALFIDAPLFDVRVRYKKIKIHGKVLKTFKTGEEEISYLFAHPDVTYMTFLWAQLLYVQLGFPPKRFDNVGNFWRHGVLYDLITTTYKKIS